MAVTTDTGEVSVQERDQKVSHDLYAKIRAAEAKLVVTDGSARVLPGSLNAFLDEVLEELRAGKSVSIQQMDAELTTSEAARLLSVSRQFLVQMLEQGQIPFHMVGTHRRVYGRDVLAYRTKRDSNRHTLIRDLARAEMDEGIYGRVEFYDAESR